MQTAMHIEPYRRPRRIYLARWLLDIGASLYGGLVVGRRATARGRQVFVVHCPCGTVRHLSVERITPQN